MSFKNITNDWAVFAHEGEVAIGAVRHIKSDGLLVYIENYGDVTLGRTDVAWAGEGKVVLQPNCLSKEILDAIAHAHDRETGNDQVPK